MKRPLADAVLVYVCQFVVTCVCVCVRVSMYAYAYVCVCVLITVLVYAGKYARECMCVNSSNRLNITHLPSNVLYHRFLTFIQILTNL